MDNKDFWLPYLFHFNYIILEILINILYYNKKNNKFQNKKIHDIIMVVIILIIIDSRMRNFEKNKLKELGYKLYEIKPNENLYYEISAHVDIHCCKILNNLIVDHSINIPNTIFGNSVLKSKYPYDIFYNVCILGNKAIHNFKYTDKTILNILEENNFEKIHINQGYSKCSIAVIDENSAIVTDKTIFEILKSYNIDVLLVDKNINENIHLFKNEKYEYSSMHGFIGGVFSRIDEFIFISGDLNIIDNDKKILLVKDSYSLPVAAFLSTCVNEVHMVDLRDAEAVNLEKYVDEYDYYGLLRDGAPDDEFISEALRISASRPASFSSNKSLYCLFNSE